MPLRVLVTLQPHDKRVKRPYRSQLRDRHHQVTRNAILDAAHKLFLANGYAGTSIKTVAEDALVSEQTVYNTFGDKASLLYAVAAQVVSQGEAKLTAELAAEADPRARVRVVARQSRQTWEHGMVEFESMVFDAAANDPRLQEMARRALEAKYEDYKAGCQILFPEGVLRPGVEVDDVVDLMLAFDSAAVVRTLTHDRGWSLDKYEHWLAQFIERLFMRPQD